MRSNHGNIYNIIFILFFLKVNNCRVTHYNIWLLTHSSHGLGGCRGVTVNAWAVRNLQRSRSSADLSRVCKLQSVHSLMLSIQAFLCLPLPRFPSTVPCRMVFDREVCLVTWPYQVSFRRLTVESRGSCSPAWVVTSCLT